MPALRARSCQKPPDASIAAPYTRLAGVKVTRVAVRGIGINTTTMTTQLATKPGALLDPETLRSDVRTLWALHVASQIGVTAEPSPDGYAIELAVVPLPRVVRVEISGATRRQLAALVAMEGTLHDQERLSRLASATKLWLRAHGYLHAELAGDSVATCEGIVVHFDVTLGKHYTLSRIAVTGSVLPAPPAMFEHDFGATNVVGGDYRQLAFVDDLDILRERHSDAGYLAAKVVPPVMKLDDKTARVAVEAKLEVGPRFKVAVAIEGGTPAQRALAETAYSPLRGAWYDKHAQDEAYDRLHHALGDHVRVDTLGLSNQDVYELRVMLRDPTP